MIETLLWSCVVALKQHYSKPRTAHHRTLLHVNGSRENPWINHVASYYDILDLAGCESIGAAGRKRRPLWAGSVVRSAAKRIHQ